MSTYSARKNQAHRQGLTYRKLLSTSALVAAGLVGLHNAPALADESWGHLNQDQGSFSTDITNPNVTNIKLNTSRAIGSGNADIYLGDTVNVDGALFVVRDTRADPTRILGNLNSNGKVIVIDDNGIFFGKDSVVDVAGLVATTGHIGNADIMDGDGHFDITNLGDAAIDMRGTINVADAGLAAFVAPTVTNSGIINARLGTVAFAAGEQVTLDMYGDGLFEVAVNGALSDALLKNNANGEINAEGGTVTMTASAAKDVVNDIINVDGVVKVSSATVKGGKIILSGGDNGKVKIAGKVDASGTTGGDINVTGQTVEITETAEIVNNGDRSNSYVFGTDKAIFRGSFQAGTNATAEISGKELVLGGTIDLDDGSTISFDPTILTVNAGEASTFVSSLNNNNVTVNVEAEQRIIVNADIDTSTQTTNSVLHFKDEDANNDLTVDLNAQITLGASQGLTGDATVVNIVNGGTLIQNGIDIATSGATVNVGAGTYGEQVDIDKSLNLVGAGSGLTILQGTGTGTGVDVDANDVALKGLTIDDYNYAVNVDTDIANLSMDDVAAINGNVGLKVSTAANIAGLNVADSHFDNNTYGWYITKGDNNLANTSTVTDVIVDGTTFNGNARKGIYAEKLNNAAFTNVTIVGSGVDAAYNYNAGIDINLKNGTYADISFDNLTVINSGIDATGFGSAVAIKARNDGATYGATPASLSNLTITNSNITAAGGSAIAIGYGVNGAHITNNTNITGPEAVAFYGGVQNVDVSGNTIFSTGLSSRGSAYGVGLFDVQTADVKSNNILGANAGSGISSVLSSDVTIGGANASDANAVFNYINGIDLAGSTGTTLIQNNIASNNTDTSAGRIASDYKTGVGILLNGATGTVSVIGNTVATNTDGIRLIDTDGANVSGNSAFVNADKGIITKSSDNVQITENTITGNKIGVYLDDSENANVQANTIDGSSADGVHLRGATTSADIQNNIITNSGIAGVNVESAASVKIYDNAFAAADGSNANAANIKNASANIVDASFNWFGSNDEAAVAASVTGAVDISPIQAAGVDTSTDAGYQGAKDALFVTTLGAQTSGLIQEAVDLIDDNGMVSVNAGDYTENLFLDVLGLKLVGFTGANLNYDTTNAGRGVAGNLITVSAANTTIDPFTFDGAGVADYGIVAEGAGAQGLTVDGNTFKNFEEAAIYIAANSATTGTIKNNIFEGSSTRGVQTGTLDGGYTLDILNNTIGNNGDEVNNAVKFGRLRNATINITDGSMDSTGDAITGGNVGSQVAINLNNLNVEAGDEAADFNGNLDGAVTINGGTLIGAGSGVEANFIGANGVLTIKNGATIRGNDATHGNGLNILQRIEGTVSVMGSIIKGGLSGIGSDGGLMDVNGGLLQVTDSILHGVIGDAIEVGNVNGGHVNIVYNSLSAGEDGIQIDGDITGASRVQLAANSIGYAASGAVGDDGIEITGDVVDSTVTLSHYYDTVRGARAQSIRANGDGIAFEGDIKNSDIQIATYISNAGVDGLRVAGDVDGSTITTGVATFDVLGGGTGALGGFQAVSGQDGVEFEGQIKNGSVVNIASNLSILGQNGDGIRLEQAVTGGSTVNISSNRNDYGGDAITGSDDGIDIGDVTGGSAVNIRNNNGIAGKNDNGIEVGSISNASTVTITDSTITADDDGIFVAGDITNEGTGLDVRSNTINAGDDGLDIDHVSNNATVNIAANNIFAGGGSSDDGIEFDAGVDANVAISQNRISAGGNGILFTDNDAGAITGVDNGASIAIVSNDIGSISGDRIGGDGIRFDGSITGNSFVNIAANNIGRSGTYVGDDGIDIASISLGSIVNIVNNSNIYAGDNGIEIGGSINNANLTIASNNRGIHAGDHGIYVGGNVYNNSIINIHDNIISASEGRNGVGDGIHFDGGIYTAEINIGNGNGNGIDNNPSNFIRGEDGIHFDGVVTNGADISIDGNRIGYGKNSAGNIFTDRVGDDGIQFIGDIAGNANISITDNYVRAGDDGVSVIGEIEDDARISIGGVNDGNTINARGTGIQFQDDIKENALLAISYNDIEARDNGIEFNGNTSNHIDGSNNPSEILIANNDVVGDQNGILFEGRASDARHDIVIRNNTQIVGNNGDGIRHEGGINDAEIAITDNARIAGRADGVDVGGFFYNDARLDITGNQNVSARFGDGIKVTDIGLTAGSDVNITDNIVTRAGDNGIEVSNIDAVDIQRNTVTNAGDDGINVDNSGAAQILFNDVNSVGDDGIDVDDSNFANINDNTITDAGENGIKLRDSAGVNIQRNLVGLIGEDGIFADDADFANIENNQIGFVSDDGIDIRDSYGAYVGENLVIFTGDNGIQVRDSDNFNAVENIVGITGNNGIDIDRSNNTTISDNLVGNNANDGIYLSNGDNATINGNTSVENGLAGIVLDDATNATVSANTTNDNTEDGIVILGGSQTTVTGNTANNNGIAGIYADGTTDLTIDGANTLDGNDNGIELYDVTTATIDGNTITNSLTTGISVENVNAIDILNNDITGSATFGLLAQGSRNGAITLGGNNFTDNLTGARFESGIIDISDLANPNSFTNTDPLATPVGLQFDEVGAPGSLSLAGNTIGGTEFNGFTNPGSFYVRIEDGALLDTVTNAPIVINGLNANYDGLVPNATGGALTQAQLDTLEDRIFDADDVAVNGRGQLFVGFVPSLGLDNLQDFFNSFGGFPPGFSGLNVLIRNAAAPAPAPALNFANIEPAAGEGEDENGEGLAEIEPAAGEDSEDAACWGDALSATGTVSYNFGGSFAESLADAANCGS